MVTEEKRFKERDAVIFVVAPVGGHTLESALRKALKRLLRGYGLRCLAVLPADKFFLKRATGGTDKTAKPPATAQKAGCADGG